VTIQRTEVLQDTGVPSEQPLNPKRDVIRSILLVKNGSMQYLLRNSREVERNGEFEQLWTVTDLLNQTWYMVEAHGSGYRLFFHLDEGEVVVELAPEADLPNAIEDVMRRIPRQDSAR